MKGNGNMNIKSYEMKGERKKETEGEKMLKWNIYENRKREKKEG